MVEIAFLKTHIAELSDNEPLAVNLQRYCCPTLEIEEVWLGTHEAKLWAMVCCMKRSWRPVKPAWLHLLIARVWRVCVVWPTSSSQAENIPRRLGVNEEHLKSHCFSLPLHRTSCSSSTASSACFYKE